LALKVPDELQALGLEDPYPTLVVSWDPRENEFGWTVPALGDIPDVGAALDLVAAFHGESGPMLTSLPQ
jgi:hypothetical protein